MRNFVIVLVCLTIVCLISGERCSKVNIAFRVAPKKNPPRWIRGQMDCSDVPNAVHTEIEYMGIIYREICILKGLCGDGRPPGEGTYCGKGPCNIFGYNCDGGCIEGNPIESFKKTYEHNTYI